MAGRFSVEAIFKAIDRITAPIARMQAAVSRFAANAIRQFDRVTAASSRIGSMLKSSALWIGGGAAAAGAALYKFGQAGLDFEQAITNVGAVSLMTRAQVADLEAKALDLGKSTKFSGTEVANAFEMMGKAGFSNQEALEGIEGVLNATAAEGGELAETASTVSNVLKGMGLEARESGRVADVLTLASARTNSSISSLGESMKTVGPVAKQFGIGLEDAVGMVALLQDVGLDASSAGTSVASALTKLANPSKRAVAMMQKMNVSFKTQAGNMKTPVELFGEMAKAVKNSNGNMEQAAFFAELVGLESQKAAINLTNAFMSGDATRLTDSLRGAVGKAKEMAGLRMQTLSGDIETLGGSIDALKIGLFTMQSGALRGVVQSMTEWLDANNAFIRSKFAEYVENARYAVELFGTGARQGFEAIQQVLGPLGRFAGIMSGAPTWPQIVLNLGRAFAGLTVAVAALMALSVATRAMSVALWAVTLAQKAYSLATDASTAKSIVARGVEIASTAATWAKIAALWAASAAMRIATVSTTAYSAAEMVSTARTWLASTARTAYNLAIGLGSKAIGLATTLTSALTAKTILSTGATWATIAAQRAQNVALGLVAVAKGVYAVATGTATAATWASVPGLVAANAAFLPLLVTVGAVAAAVGALVAVWKAWDDLATQTGGAMGVLKGIKSLFTEGSFFSGVDEDLNQKAREAAAARQRNAAAKQMVPPAERTASAIEERQTTTTHQAELTIKDPGKHAVVTKAPKNGAPLTITPSGAF